MLPQVLTAIACVLLAFAQGAQDLARESSALEELPPAQRKLVEEDAKYFERFPDGSLWTRRVEAERDARKKGSPVLDAYSESGTPLWYCPSKDTKAATKEEIFDSLDEADIRDQLKDGQYFKNARTLFVTPRGILVDAGKELVLLDPPAKELVREGTTLDPFSAVPEGVEFFIVPSRSPALRELPSGNGSSFQPLPPGRWFFWGQTLQMKKWKVVDSPKSRVKRETTTVSPNELAEAIRSRNQPGIVVWSPTSERKGERGELRWKWISKVTKLNFKSEAKSDQKPRK